MNVFALDFSYFCYNQSKNRALANGLIFDSANDRKSFDIKTKKTRSSERVLNKQGKSRIYIDMSG